MFILPVSIQGLIYLFPY